MNNIILRIKITCFIYEFLTIKVKNFSFICKNLTKFLSIIWFFSNIITMLIFQNITNTFKHNPTNIF